MAVARVTQQDAAQTEPRAGPLGGRGDRGALPCPELPAELCGHNSPVQLPALLPGIPRLSKALYKPWGTQVGREQQHGDAAGRGEAAFPGSAMRGASH